eukprot:Gb_39666 [translate_table: standard]
MIKDAQPIDGELLRKAKRLEKFLKVTLGWSFDKDISGKNYEENDEFAPVVLTEEELMVVDEETGT